MRYYPLSSYSVIFLLGFFVLNATDILANPLIYAPKPWDEDKLVSIMEGVGGTGSNTTGEKSASDTTLESYESGEMIKSEESILMGGDFSKMSSAAANSTSLVRQNYNYFFTSPMAVAHSAVAMTGGIIHQGLVKAQEASQREVQGAFAQEQAYLTSLAATPDGARLIAAYRNCKERILAGNPDGSSVPPIPVTNLQAIKHCVGGYTEAPYAAVGSGGALSVANASTQVQLEDQENLPDPIYVEQAVRDSGGSSTSKQVAINFCKLPTSTYDNQENCFERSLWDYVYHFVKKRPTIVLEERNPNKWMWSDEKALYFGNVKYIEYKIERESAASAALGDEQKNQIKKGYEVLPPATRWVNFWGPNGDSLSLPGVVPADYEDGTWSPLSGIELIRAPFFQDIYGGLYALSMKMCEHANAEIDLLKDNNYNGLNLRCELWDAPLDAEWSVDPVLVPGLGVQALGCKVKDAVTAPKAIALRSIFPTTNNVDYESLWPSRLRLADSAAGGLPAFADSNRVNWQPRRYYENWETISDFHLPKIKTLLQHLEMTEVEAYMLRDILLYEIPKDTATGEYQCNEILSGISYGEIMEFSEEKTANVGHDDEWYIPTKPNYKTPKSTAWPIRSKVTLPNFSGPSINKEKEISKRISLFYIYANLLGKMRALSVVEKHLGSLNNQVSSAQYFPEQMQDAARLIRSQLPGESIGASMTQRTHLRAELLAVKEMLRDFHGELKSATRFTDKAGTRRNPAAGAAGAP